jgi:hypothetical protein
VLDRADSSLDRVTVEPPANYFVGRVARDFRGGATQIRGIVTSVIRDLGDDAFMRARLNTHSEAFGIGTDWYFRRRDYRLMAQIAGTQVSGDTGAIRRQQVASARYFNRPDRKQGSNGLISDAYDPAATSMRGLGAYMRFSRETGKMLWEVATNIRTPGFENNDIAFITRADYIWMNGNILRQWTRPTSWYRSLFFIVGGQQQYNFDGDLTDRQGQVYFSIQPLNYWNISTFYIRRASFFDDRRTRGGAVVRLPGINIFSGNVSTDSRKRIVFGVNGEYSCSDEHFCTKSAGLSAQIKPASNISISLGPSFFHSRSGVQWVGNFTDATATNFYGTRHVFADLEQRQLAMSTRVNVTFTTRLTFELFVQPLIASGEYQRFSEYAAPRGVRRLYYGTDIGTVTDSTTTTANGPLIVHHIDPDSSGATNGPAPRFSITDPNFVFRSLRGNAVLRWEYRPGSTIYLVWTRSGSSSVGRGNIDFGDDTSSLLRGPSDNIFLVKVNYRIGL